MVVKIVGLCLTFSCLFLCVNAAKKYFDVTEDEFANMKGKDIAAVCKDKASMEDVCNHLRTLRNLEKAGVPFVNGYPKCHESSLQVKKKDGKGILLEKVKFILCAWGPPGCNGYVEYLYTRGRCANCLMNCDCNPASCLPFTEFEYK